MSKLDEILNAHSVVCYDDADDKSYQRSVEIMNDCRKEIEFTLKLKELVKARIIPLEKELEIIHNTPNGVKSCGSEYHLKILNERNYYTTLLKESEK